jgi:dienelactone hydrolase
VLDQAAVLARHDFGVLLFDARGHGRSGGRAMDFGWYGDADVDAAVTYLSRRADVDAARIGAVGMSMGGEQAIGAAATDERIRAVVGEGVTSRVPADKSWMPNDVVGVVTRVQTFLTYQLADLLTSASQPIALRDAVRAAAPRPVLVIEGKEAHEIDSGRAIRDASPRTVQLWELPDAPHTDGVRTHPQEWASTVTTFLEDALLR